MIKEKIVIIGNGIAGLSAAEAARKNNSDIDICIISGEDFLTYYRLRLFDLFHNYDNFENLYIKKPDWYKERNIELILGSKVQSIDKLNNCITLLSGETIEYTKLILANGSDTVLPKIPGSDKKGVYTVRTIMDMKKINERLDKVNDVVVVGGGLLGLEAAYQISRKNKNVTIVEYFPKLLEKQLDEKGAEVFEEIMGNCNIKIKTSSKVTSLEGEEFVNSVVLDGGEKIKSDIVIFSVGVSPKTDIAKGTDLEVNRGIIVDESMRTNLENIFAVGDIAEYSGKTYGLWSVAMNQGKIAGINASGGDETYVEEIQPYFLNSMGTKVYSVGDVGKKAEDYDTLEFLDREKLIYNKLYFSDNLLVGAVLIGDISSSGKVVAAIKNQYTKDQIFSMALLNFQGTH